MVRTLSDFKYLTGTKWLRPALLVPSDGKPIVFVARNEVEGFMEFSKLRNVEVVEYSDGGDLMGKVSSTIRSIGARRVGMVYGVERDSYLLFYEMFRRVNRDVEVVDIGDILVEMRVIKEPFEINAIAEASDIASRVIEETAKLVKEGVSETDLAAEAYYVAFKQGSEEPHIYINIGPYPRVHAEPTRHARVKNGVLVTIVVGVDYEGYYSNASTTLYVGGSKPEHVSNAFKCAYEVYEEAVNQTKPSVRFVDVMKRLDEIYSRYGLLNSRVKGYLHGVGLQIEEYPITTIVPGHRVAEARAGMVVAMVHSPLMLKGYGSLKIEARSI